LDTPTITSPLLGGDAEARLAIIRARRSGMPSKPAAAPAGKVSHLLAGDAEQRLDAIRARRAAQLPGKLDQMSLDPVQLAGNPMLQAHQLRALEITGSRKDDATRKQGQLPNTVDANTRQPMPAAANWDLYRIGQQIARAQPDSGIQIDPDFEAIDAIDSARVPAYFKANFPGDPTDPAEIERVKAYRSGQSELDARRALLDFDRGTRRMQAGTPVNATEAARQRLDQDLAAVANTTPQGPIDSFMAAATAPIAKISAGVRTLAGRGRQLAGDLTGVISPEAGAQMRREGSQDVASAEAMLNAARPRPSGLAAHIVATAARLASRTVARAEFGAPPRR
jgi:hypothetical protein